MQGNDKIAPKQGSEDYFMLLNFLGYLASELHPSIGGLFTPSLSEPVKEFIKGNGEKKLQYLENNVIGDKNFLVGNSFSIADSYLYIILSWTQDVGIDLATYPKLNNYFKSIAELENVKAAHKRIESDPSSTI